jgi:hypothetical protein
LTRAAHRALDAIPTLDGVSDAIGAPPRIVTVHAGGFGHWTPNEPVPAITPVSPAEAQALARCLAARIRGVGQDLLPSGRALHSSRCEWCSAATEDLLRACDYAIFASRFVADEYAVWEVEGDVYRRDTGVAGTYENPVWRRYYEARAVRARPDHGIAG